MWSNYSFIHLFCFPWNRAAQGWQKTAVWGCSVELIVSQDVSSSWTRVKIWISSVIQHPPSPRFQKLYSRSIFSSTSVSQHMAHISCSALLHPQHFWLLWGCLVSAECVGFAAAAIQFSALALCCTEGEWQRWWSGDCYLDTKQRPITKMHL